MSGHARIGPARRANLASAGSDAELRQSGADPSVTFADQAGPRTSGSPPGGRGE